MQMVTVTGLQTIKIQNHVIKNVNCLLHENKRKKCRNAGRCNN